MFDPNSYLSFSDYNSFSGGFGVSPPSPEAFTAVVKEEQTPLAVAGETPATPNSSISSASTEGNKKEVKEALEDEEDQSSKKDGKAKKKGGKKEKQARFAFMTKSEVDHLEDGYRWRKYGQKAVKNSPYPRSYYRCTTQKCPVKKRVERSFQDPSIVITTYEGQHNHHLPATLRGNMAAGMFAPPPEASSSFTQELLVHMPNLYGYGGDGGTSNIVYHQQNLSSTTPHHQQVHQFPDYGLLQDIIPPRYPKQEP
nr:WRKY transcription factor [Rehmannia glutinosa]